MEKYFKRICDGDFRFSSGISGGTIALLLGIYDDFISSISGLFSKRFWPSLKFLLPILIGMILAIGVLSNLIHYLLDHHHVITMFFLLV